VKKSIRRLVQVAFFVLFLFLLVQTEYKGEDTLGQPVRVFLEIDPLLTIASIVAAGGFFLFAVGLAIALALAVGAARLIGLAGSALGLDEQARRLLARYLPLALLTALLVWAVFPFGFDRGLPLPMG